MKLQYVQAGEIVTSHGIKGDVKVLPWSDGPEFLLSFKRVCIHGTDYKVESCRVQKNCNLLKLSGIDSIESAQALRGAVIEVHREDVPMGMLFAAELIGVNVFADGTMIGQITDVLDYPGNKVYVIEGEHTYMVPAVKEFVLHTDIEENVMQVMLIEGMRTDEN